MADYVFADPHYAHKNIAGPNVSNWSSGYRDFENTYYMNNAIVSSTNNLVKEDDTLYCLGDWSFGGKDKIAEFREKLVVKNLHLIYGNHDKRIKNNKEYQDLFSSTQDYLEIYQHNVLFVLFHYPMRVWLDMSKGAIHLHGHCHHKIPNLHKSMDVGWCKWRRPLSFKEIISMLEKEKNVDPSYQNQ